MKKGKSNGKKKITNEKGKSNGMKEITNEKKKERWKEGNNE